MKATVKVLALVLLGFAFVTGPGAQPTLEGESQKQMVLTRLADMPLAFTENRGQWQEKVLFRAEAGGATFYFCKNEVAYLFVRDTDELIDDDPVGWHAFPEEKHGIAQSRAVGFPDALDRPRYKKESLLIKAQFLGANPDPEIMGVGRLPHNNNYFLGNDPDRWHTDAPNYSAVIYKEIYPGIDLKYYGDGHSMKYDFIVHPGADVSQIRIRYDGVEELSVSSAGDLQAQTSFGLVYEKAPDIYQHIDGVRYELAGRYEIRGEGLFGFVLEDGYDPAYPLVIDPELLYSTYLGGNSDDQGRAIAVDGAGNVYITGWTYSTDFPTENAYQTDQPYQDVFVTKLAPGGSSLVYGTYLGGNDDDWGRAIAADADGNAYITGFTLSLDFPTENPYQGTYNGGYRDGFVTKLAPAGDSLIYSTYLGGDRDDGGLAVAADANGYTYVTGFTFSTDFPTQNPYQTDQLTWDAFVSKLVPEGNLLVYSTYLGGGDWDLAYGLAVDTAGYAYVTGYTSSPDFPVENPYDGSFNDSTDVFVSKLSAAGNSLIYSTYLGGSSLDGGYAIALDASGNAYVTGRTVSPDFPTENPHDGSRNGGLDAFVTKLSVAGNSLIYSTYLGGSDLDEGYGIAVDGAGNAYITGWTSSADFPTENPYQTDQLGDDVFVAKITPSGNSLAYSTYLGGDNHDEGRAIAVDAAGNAYVTGVTYSSDFPTQNPCQTDQPGWDVLLTKLAPEGDSLIYSTYLGGNGDDVGHGIAVGLADDAYLTGVTQSTDFPTQSPYDGAHNGGRDGFVSKFGPEGPTPCIYISGDVNGNGAVNVVDITALVNWLVSGQQPACPCECLDNPPFYACADVNGNCAVNVVDVTALVNWLVGGVPVSYCADCPPAE